LCFFTIVWTSSKCRIVPIIFQLWQHGLMWHRHIRVKWGCNMHQKWCYGGLSLGRQLVCHHIFVKLGCHELAIRNLCFVVVVIMSPSSPTPLLCILVPTINLWTTFANLTRLFNYWVNLATSSTIEGINPMCNPCANIVYNIICATNLIMSWWMVVEYKPFLTFLSSPIDNHQNAWITLLKLVVGMDVISLGVMSFCIHWPHCLYL
jgi:hypothetical protein